VSVHSVVVDALGILARSARLAAADPVLLRATRRVRARCASRSRNEMTV
jgi:hypothetical protein